MSEKLVTEMLNGLKEPKTHYYTKALDKITTALCSAGIETKAIQTLERMPDYSRDKIDGHIKISAKVYISFTIKE